MSITTVSILYHVYESKYFSTNLQNTKVVVNCLNMCFYHILCVTFSQENKLWSVEWIICELNDSLNYCGFHSGNPAKRGNCFANFAFFTFRSLTNNAKIFGEKFFRFNLYSEKMQSFRKNRNEKISWKNTKISSRIY